MSFLGLALLNMRKFTRFFIWPVIAGIGVAILTAHYYPELIGLEPATTPSPLITNNNLGNGPVSYATAVNNAAPAVVNIYAKKVVKQRSHPFFNDPYLQHYLKKWGVKQQQRIKQSLGSGVIISQQGYILTNNHTISGAAEIRIATYDGRETNATIIGVDTDTDLAVLKIDLDNLPTISIAPSDTISVGDIALAIGNPFGVGQTVTMGIVSATGRNQRSLNRFEGFIQTDAAINPGNSGGALINAHGDLIGVNTAIVSKSGGSHGIGFAIPSNLAEQIMSEIIIRGWLGLEPQTITPELAESLGINRENGIIIAGIYRNGPAYLAGLKPRDIIIKINKEDVITVSELTQKIANMKNNDTTLVEYIRENQTYSATINVTTPPK